MLTLTDGDFSRLVQLVHTRYGINLSKKRELITSRLSSTLEGQGYTSFTAYLDHLMANGSQDDFDLLLNKLTTNYTFFMREKEHYDFFERVIMPDLVARHQRDRVLSIWSAGCSTGEEPYNISMYLKDYLGRSASQWDTRVLATDISQRALAEAKKGIYSLPDTLPSKWKNQFFVPQPGGDRYAVAPDIRRNVIFRTFNLMDPIKFKLKFDVIFCRNVMIYFDQPTKDALVRRFLQATRPGGYLLIGHSESIDKSAGYRFIQPATFQKP